MARDGLELLLKVSHVVKGDIEVPILMQCCGWCGLTYHTQFYRVLAIRLPASGRSPPGIQQLNYTPACFVSEMGSSSAGAACYQIPRLKQFPHLSLPSAGASMRYHVWLQDLIFLFIARCHSIVGTSCFICSSGDRFLGCCHLGLDNNAALSVNVLLMYKLFSEYVFLGYCG